MMDKLRVTIKNAGEEIGFTFGGDYLADALRFIGDCMETCDNGTEVSITRYFYEEDEE